MANPTRILFISGEVAPFAKHSELAEIVRLLPEKLQETSEYEMRIMMPRYGTISERRNRLHEVIRLSGTDVVMGSEKESLKVKVASIPGIRLQVYFMDNNRYFKKKGATEKPSKSVDENAQRALFFGRAALQTIRNLGWSPDIVHSFGWISALVPGLLQNEFGSDPLFENTKSVFTPDLTDMDVRLSSELARSVLSNAEHELVDQDMNTVGKITADLFVYPPFLAPSEEGAPQLPQDREELVKQAMALYESVLTDVLA